MGDTVKKICKNIAKKVEIVCYLVCFVLTYNQPSAKIKGDFYEQR